jgi:hypothetical protein
VTDFPGEADTVLGLAAQGSQSVALVGTISGVYLTRFTDSGALDTRFGSGGLTPVSGAALAVQPDGKIVVAGDALYRFNANGTLDTSFGNGGVIASPIGALRAVALQPQGQIIAASLTEMARFRCVSATTPQDATRAIIYQVNALLRSGRLSPAQAQELIGSANAVIASLSH